MNLTRVRRLAGEGRVEIPRKVFKRLTRDGFHLDELMKSLTQAELKAEDVLASPDFACALGVKSRERPWDLICVQCPDGTAIRLVGLFRLNNRKQKSKKRGER